MQHLLDRELALAVQVRPRPTPFRHDAALLVGEQTHSLRSASVDTENVHAIN